MQKAQIARSRNKQVASAEFDRQGQEYDEERLLDQITETLKVCPCLLR